MTGYVRDVHELRKALIRQIRFCRPLSTGNEVAADEIDPVPLLFWSARAAARTDRRCGAIAHAYPVHLRSTQVAITRVQHRCGASAAE